jgi:hypothetical protein
MGCGLGLGLGTSAHFNGRATRGDLSLMFVRSWNRGFATRVGDIARRAAVFKPGFVSATLWWILLFGWVVVGTAGLAGALWVATGRGLR